MRPKLKAEDIKLVQHLYNIKVNDDIADAILIGRAYTQDNCVLSWG